MADSINGVTFVGVLGNVALPRDTATPITDLNEDGEAYAQAGRHTPVTQLRAGQGYANAAAAATALATYQAWILTAVTVVQNGVTYTNRLVLDVEKIPESEVTSPTYSGGNGAHWAEFVFTLQYAAAT